MKRAIIVTLLLILPILVIGQTDKTKSNPWETLSFLEGIWTGTGEGMSGSSTAEVNFEFVLKNKFLKVTTRSVFEPQKKNPKGEIHEDFGFISYDKGRELFVLRAFYVEGFVITYVLTAESIIDNSYTFLSEHVENGPPGTKAKLIFTKNSVGSMTEEFFVAFGGQEYGCFSTNQLTKK